MGEKEKLSNTNFSRFCLARDQRENKIPLDALRLTPNTSYGWDVICLQIPNQGNSTGKVKKWNASMGYNGFTLMIEPDRVGGSVDKAQKLWE